MQSDYQIDDILSQTNEFLIYRAIGKDGESYTITRLKYPEEILNNLRDGRFEKALSELKSMDHSCLRPTVDGGLDPIDHQPWIATRSWEGKSLEDYVNAGKLTSEDILRMEAHGTSLIDGVVKGAGSLDFRPSEIVLAIAVNGESIVTFAFDYLVWFRDVAMGYEPGYKEDARAIFKELISSLKPTKGELTTAPLATDQFSVEPSTETPSGAAAPTVLASASGGGGGAKFWITISILIALLAGGGWWAMKLNDQKKKGALSDEQVDEVEEPVVRKEPVLQETKPPQAKLESKSDLESEPVVMKSPSLPVKSKPVLQARPSVGAMSEVAADDLKSLEENVGYWVILKGQVKNIGNGVELSFENSNLKASLLEGQVPAEMQNQTVTAVGRLIDQSTLEVTQPGDIETYVEVAELPKKDVYGVEDEEQLRTMVGQTVTVLAEVRKVKTSKSGATLYLVLNDSKPEFTAAIRTLYVRDGLGRDYLDSLLGKKIKVTGKVKVERGYGKRLNISFRDKEALEISE